MEGSAVASGKKVETLMGNADQMRKMGTWDGRCHDPSLNMYREAVRYAEARGIPPELMPELRSENGVLHAYRPNGKKLKLEAGPGWEHRSGYSVLVGELEAQMQARLPRV